MTSKCVSTHYTFKVVTRIQFLCLRVFVCLMLKFLAILFKYLLEPKRVCFTFDSVVDKLLHMLPAHKVLFISIKCEYCFVDSSAIM